MWLRSRHTAKCPLGSMFRHLLYFALCRQLMTAKISPCALMFDTRQIWFRRQGLSTSGLRCEPHTAKSSPCVFPAKPQAHGEFLLSGSASVSLIGPRHQHHHMLVSLTPTARPHHLRPRLMNLNEQHTCSPRTYMHIPNVWERKLFITRYC